MWIFVLVSISIVVFIAFVSLLVAVVTTVAGRENRERGRRGENIVADILQSLPGDKFVINGLLFSEAGHMRQIDHVCVRHNGIWVVETKNRAGNIYGGDTDKWVQTFSNSLVRNEFPNPVRQNKTHLYALAKCLNLRRDIFRNLVVFVNPDMLCVDMAEVCTAADITSAMDVQTGIDISYADMQKYRDMISEFARQTATDSFEHMRRDISVRKKKIRHRICPRCGCKLVLSDTEKGVYYVCSNFPKCGFRINPDELKKL